MLKYRAYIKDKYLTKTRAVNVKACDALEAHKFALKTVHLEREDVLKIIDEDGTIVFNFAKGFLSKH
jgi:hypothetical protein